MLDEINPIISQMGWESISCTIEVLQSFRIDIKQKSKVLFAKSIMNKSLEQDLKSHAVGFNSRVTIPQRLSYEKDKIKSFKLFWTFAEKGPRTMMQSNLPNRENFIKALEIDKWSKKHSKNTFKLSLSFTGKSNHVITIGLPQTINRNECPVPHENPILYSKYLVILSLLTIILSTHQAACYQVKGKNSLIIIFMVVNFLLCCHWSYLGWESSLSWSWSNING